LAQGLGFVRDGRIVAGVTYHNVNGYDCHMSAAVEPGFQWSRWSLAVIFQYPFIQLGLNRVTALIDADNVESQRFVKRLGLTLEARLSEACRSGDLLVYRLFRRECRWLSLRDRSEPIQETSRPRHA
jgi:hypothetical protein